MKRLLPPSPTRSRGKKVTPSSVPPSNPPRSVFDSEDFSASKAEIRTINLDSETHVPEPLERSVQIDINLFKATWEKIASSQSPSITSTIANNYALLDTLSALQEDIRGNGLDPNVELLSPTFDRYFNVMINLSLLAKMAETLFPDPVYRSTVMTLIAENMIEKVKNTGSSPNPMRELLGKLSKEKSDGDPYGIGISHHDQKQGL